MAAVSLFWDTIMAAVTLCENTLQAQERTVRLSVSPSPVPFFFAQITSKRPLVGRLLHNRLLTFRPGHFPNSSVIS